MTRPELGLLCLLLVALPSCARTVYTNLHPQLPAPSVAPAVERSSPRYWRHFFIFGWVPGELVVDASAYCEGTERIERIETRRSFVQVFVTLATSIDINIYSPYTGRVVCDRHTQDRD